jgi:hypothetical protein
LPPPAVSARPPPTGDDVRVGRSPGAPDTGRPDGRAGATGDAASGPRGAMAPANDTVRSRIPPRAGVSWCIVGRRASVEGEAATGRRESKSGVLGAIFMPHRERKRSATRIAYINSRTCRRAGPPHCTGAWAARGGGCIRRVAERIVEGHDGRTGATKG